MRLNSSKYNQHWEDKALSELGDFQRGKSRHRPRNDRSLFIGGEHPLIQTGEVKAANLYITEHSTNYNDVGLAQSKLWPKDTLCITIAANIAETALLGYPMCFPDSVVGFIADEEQSSELFMHYVFTYIRRAIQNSATGSIQDNINIEYLTGLKFKIPKKDYQDKIVEVLSALDAKIDCNNRINAKLEEMAKTLYDYWFVQFEFPDTNDKPYKSSGGKMVYNEVLKREIPEGWHAEQLVNLTKLIRRGISPSYVDQGCTSVLNQKCIREQRILFHEARWHGKSLEDDDERLLQHLDVLINSTGVGTLGRVAFVKRLEEQTTTFDSHLTIVRADDRKINPDYLAWTMLRFQPLIVSAANGSTGQVELSKTFVEDLRVIIPANLYQTGFSAVVSPLIRMMAANEKQIELLTKIRDWLLPMLMNGQVRVAEAGEK